MSVECNPDGPINICEMTNVSVGLPPFLVALGGQCAAIGLIFIIMNAPTGNDVMRKIAKAIQDGAKTFLKLEYTALATMVILLFILVSAAVNWRTGLCYLCGATVSAACGWLGMWISTESNVKTAAAAEFGLNQALRVAFNSGSVMGLSVVSMGLGSLSCLLMIFGNEAVQGVGALAGFGMGASTVSIFARVGGGIYTKAADVGADLVGKVEKNLPEDDARNPATIADNVGDNVGDVAGMGADLFSSFCGSIIASALLGASEHTKDLPMGINEHLVARPYIALPFWISMSGIVASIIGMTAVRCDDNATQVDLLNVLRRSQFLAGIFQIAFMAVVVRVLDVEWQLFGCILIGLVAGLSIGVISEVFTSFAHSPTRNIAKSARIGAANVVIEGLSVGMHSTVAPALIVGAVLISTKSLAGPYGIALASTGLLSTLGITLATDAYGPVADNAGGIAEMAHMPAHVRKNTDVLDALGNTTAAIGKGFAVGSAVLTAFSLLTTFFNRVSDTPVDPIGDDFFLAGIIVGGMVPYMFGALTMAAVNKAAQSVVVEVRRQFHSIPGLMEGTVDPDYKACVAMITTASLHAMLFPVLLTVLSPIIVGVGLGPSMLTGFLIGAILSGFLLGGLMSTAGGAWDNAKKYIESGVYGGKRSDPHKAAVVGDTIGDPFKDTSGPALNIVIKLMSYISVVLVPVFKNQADYWWASLIIIGVVAAFIPWWIHMTPDSLRPESVEAMIQELAGAKAGGAPPPAEHVVQVAAPERKEPPKVFLAETTSEQPDRKVEIVAAPAPVPDTDSQPEPVAPVTPAAVPKSTTIEPLVAVASPQSDAEAPTSP